jgi:RHS repeat-associated protein
METNENGQVISYEEYHPFGTSAYRTAKSGTDLSLKRYRFTNKERDDETGLYYFGVRYYAAWLGRWTSSDPGDFVDGLNMYQYAQNNPVKLVDEEGYNAVEPEKVEPKEGEGTNALGDAADEITVTASSLEEGREDDPPETIRDEEGGVINPNGGTSDFAEDWYSVVEGNLVMTNGTDYQVWNSETSEYDVGRKPAEWKGRAPLENIPYEKLQIGDIYKQSAPDPGGINYSTGIFGDSRKLQYAGNSSWVELERYSSLDTADYVTLFFPIGGGGGVSKILTWLGKFYAGKRLIFAARSIWKMPAKGPQSRGFVYEKMLKLKGLMKTSNFPTIDAFHKGVATSVKTMNLNAKSYQKGNAVYNKLKKYVDDLVNFKDTTWGGQTVLANDVKSKVLELGIPRGATQAQLKQVKKAVEYAKQEGVKFNYKVVK